ncbi:MAG: 50S ribosomal protein L7Ae [Candidatus Hodarchaeales archaeon]|jgi:large subunit ribosomal protein L7Ae
MSDPFYVRFKQPEGIEEEALKILSKSERIRKGTNETTKSIERLKAKIVFISKDVDPPEIVGHLPLLCEEKKIPYVYVKNRKELGKAARLKVPTASCAILDAGSARKDLDAVAKRLKELAGL